MISDINVKLVDIPVDEHGCTIETPEMELAEAKMFGFNTVEEYRAEIQRQLYEGDVMDATGFVDSCIHGEYVDDDGVGYFSNDEHEYEHSDEFIAVPSRVAAGDYKHGCKYVHWFNK